MKKRILHCAYSGLGGHAAVLFTLLESHGRDEFDHFVLFFGVEDLCEEYAQTCRRLGVPFAFVKKRGRVALRSHTAVMQTIRRVRPHVVMINGTSLAVPVLGARAVLRHTWAVAVRETQANHLKTRLEWVGSYAAARAATAVVYLTEEYRAEVESRLKLPPGRGRAHVIPNGVDTDAYGTRLTRAEGPIRLAMVSRLISIKDHTTLIEAVRILVFERNHRQLELHVAGDGPTRADLEERVRAAGLAGSVTFVGLLARPGVIALLQGADIYVHCTFGETMSNSILQAMASGLPVVASDVKGVSNLIRHGEDGLLVPVAQAVPLADAIEQLIRAPDTRRVLGANGRERIVADLSQRRMAENYYRLFARLAGPNGST
jgi:glycosyltransferase involved in cell wall biosynthesis